MTPTEITTLVQAVGASAGVLAAVLAWLAKLRWSSEFKAAKEAEIGALKQQVELAKQAKDSAIEPLKQQIELLQQFSPIKVREYLISIKTSLEEYNDKLQADLEKAQQEKRSREATLKELKQQLAASASAGKAAVETKIEIVTAQRNLLDDVVGAAAAAVGSVGDATNFLTGQIGGLGGWVLGMAMPPQSQNPEAKPLQARETDSGNPK